MASQIAPDGLADGTKWPRRWHQMALQMAPDGLADGTRWPCRWHQMALRMAPDDLLEGTSGPRECHCFMNAYKNSYGSDFVFFDVII
jgi:hypothetical protein